MFVFLSLLRKYLCYDEYRYSFEGLRFDVSKPMIIRVEPITPTRGVTLETQHRKDDLP
jgi:hypothetical protein